MPLFFFHLRTPDGLDPDDEGLVMADLETAYLQACASIPDMAAELVQKGLSPMPYSFVIADPAGELLMEVPFSERLRDPRRHPRPNQCARARRLSVEVADAIDKVRASLQHSREILARSSGNV